MVALGVDENRDSFFAALLDDMPGERIAVGGIMGEHSLAVVGEDERVKIADASFKLAGQSRKHLGAGMILKIDADDLLLAGK